jgi:hypothetical protein
MFYKKINIFKLSVCYERRNQVFLFLVYSIFYIAMLGMLIYGLIVNPKDAFYSYGRISTFINIINITFVFIPSCMACLEILLYSDFSSIEIKKEDKVSRKIRFFISKNLIPVIVFLWIICILGNLFYVYSYILVNMGFDNGVNYKNFSLLLPNLIEFLSILLTRYNISMLIILVIAWVLPAVIISCKL